MKEIRDDFEAATTISLKERQVHQVMKEQLDLSYKRIVRLAPQANSVAKLIQRQQCAIVFLKLYKSKRRFVNIDESWLDSVRYHRRSWQLKKGSRG